MDHQNIKRYTLARLRNQHEPVWNIWHCFFVHSWS